MYFLLFIWTYGIFVKASITVATDAGLDILANNIVQDIQPKQGFLFTYKTNEIIKSKFDSLMQRIIGQIPIIVIDFQNIRLTRDNRSLATPELVGHKDFSLSLILYHKSNSNITHDFQKMINFLIDYNKVDSVFPKPNCLVVFFNDKTSSDVQFVSFLIKAWNRKFLDLTVIEVMSSYQTSSDDVIYMHSYNPFYKIFNKRIFNSSLSIFPDKVNDLNSLSLKGMVVYSQQHLDKVDYTFDKREPIISTVLNFSSRQFR